MRFIPIIGFLGFVILLVALLIGRPDVKPDSQGSQPLPALSLTAFKGEGVWKQEALQGQVTVLNFFASWCAPCEVEMPELTAMKKQFPNLSLLGVAWNDENGALTKWLATHGHAFDTVWMDNKGEATIALGIKGIPETILIDKRGRIRYRLAGPLTETVRTEQLAPLVVQLLAEDASAQ